MNYFPVTFHNNRYTHYILTVIDYEKVNLLTLTTPDGSFSIRSNTNRVTSSNTGICLCQKKKGISLDFYQSFPTVKYILNVFQSFKQYIKAGPCAEYLSKTYHVLDVATGLTGFDRTG